MEDYQPKIINSVFTVAEKKYLSPNYIRVQFHLTERQLEYFRNMTIGAHNKIFIPVKDESHTDLDGNLVWDLEKFAFKRTYTTRNVDWDSQTLWIDFVAHGDNGPASAWAIHAQKGDILGIAMRESKRPLVPQRDNYLLIGDMTAIPVISVILEQLPTNTKAQVILEVYNSEDEFSLFSLANVDLTWLHNPKLDRKSRLMDFVKNKSLPSPGSFVFIAAESEAVKTLKIYFKDENNWKKEDYHIVSYWKRNQSEDESQAERAIERQSSN